ncbi:hypothetical protein HDE_06670 [Halotydeus destructor]|nr:hypothetical protein HDE_06670 [Halotydeus destructor]
MVDPKCSISHRPHSHHHHKEIKLIKGRKMTIYELITNRLKVYTPIVSFVALLSTISWIIVHFRKPEACFEMSLFYVHLQVYHFVVIATTAVVCLLAIPSYGRYTEKLIYLIGMSSLLATGALLLFASYWIYWRPCVPGVVFDKEDRTEMAAMILKNRSVFESDDRPMMAVFCLDVTSAVILLSAAASAVFTPSV